MKNKFDKNESIRLYKKYVKSYKAIDCIEEPECFIEDMLYGIGASLSDEYDFASGYNKFILEFVKPLVDREEEKNRKWKDLNNIESR